jgi:hypothetical protein
VAPPEVGGGRHGYGQSGVSADVAVLLLSTAIRQRRTVGRKALDMAACPTPVCACERGRA